MNNFNEKHVKILKPVPAELFCAAKEEILKIDWKNLPVADTRSKRGIFKSSISNNLRVHRLNKDSPNTYESNANTIDCVDTKARELYPDVGHVVNWIFKEVEGFQLGRIMLVKLLSGGCIPTHVDAGDYFQFHYRLHLPIVTDQKVVFTGSAGAQPIHMPEQNLCQLLNLNPHGVENNSKIDRIHLIIDIASHNKDFLYEMR